MDSEEFWLMFYNPEPPHIDCGRWYTIQRDGRTERLKAVKEYPRHWLFEDEHGVRECITHWELARVIL